MKKAIVVSFFKSSNLGDLALSLAIENLVKEKGFELIKYDFPTTTLIKENYNITNFHDEIKTSSNDDRKKPSMLRKYLKHIKKIIQKIFPPSLIEILLYKYNVSFSRKWKAYISDVNSSDIVILAGGNMVMDISERFSIPNWSTIFLTYCKIANNNKKPLYVSSVGVGPIKYDENKFFFAKALKMANRISVRDPLSKELCETLVSNRRIYETVDPVFSLKFDMKSLRTSKIFDSLTIKIGVCVIAEHCFSKKEDYELYMRQIFNLIRTLNEKTKGNQNINFVLFSTETADYLSIERLKINIQRNTTINVQIEKLDKIPDLIELYKKLNFLIGGRMHSLIFAQLCLLPFIGVIWQEKLTGFGKITETEDRIYALDLLNEQEHFICEKIIRDLTDLSLIDKMENTNKKLNSLAINGII